MSIVVRARVLGLKFMLEALMQLWEADATDGNGNVDPEEVRLARQVRAATKKYIERLDAIW